MGNHPPRFNLTSQNVAVGFVIIDNEQPFASEFSLVSRQVFRFLIGRCFHQDGKMKRRTDANFAFHPDGTAHHLRQAFADDQSEPRPPILARHRSIDLAERAEQLLPLILSDANAGISNGKVELVAVIV